jgi:uncharacterized protein
VARQPGLIRGMNAETVARVIAFLDAHHVMSLATSGESGPHAANVLYVRDDFALLWVSDPISRHSREIDDDARVAATIAADYTEIAAIRGVQISGRARAITGASGRSIARRLLEARYRPLQQLFEGSLRQACESMEVYRLEPARIVLIDNSRGFAHKDTLDLAPAQQAIQLSA